MCSNYLRQRYFAPRAEMSTSDADRMRIGDAIIDMTPTEFNDFHSPESEIMVKFFAKFSPYIGHQLYRNMSDPKSVPLPSWNLTGSPTPLEAATLGMWVCQGDKKDKWKQVLDETGCFIVKTSMNSTFDGSSVS